MIGGHARHFHDRAIGREIAPEADDTAGFGKRGRGGVDDLAIGFAGDQVKLFAHGAAGHGHAILVDQADLAQFLHHDGHAADLVEVFGHILPAGLHIDEIGRVLEDLADIEQVEIDPGLMRDGGQVQTGIGRAAGAGNDARRVFQRFAGDDVARAQPGGKQPHHRLAGGHTILVAGLVRCGCARGIGQRQTDRLGHAGHGVGGELATASPRAGAGDAFDDRQCLVRQIARLMLAHGLEHILHGDILAIEAAGQDRAAIDEHRWHVQPHHRHHHARQRLVTTGKAHQRVVAMAAHGQFDRVGDRIARSEAGAHPFMAHGDAIGHGDGREFTRRAAAVLDADLDGLRLTVERDVARCRFVPAGGNADEGLMDFLVIQAHCIEIRPVRRARRAFGDMPTRQF